MPSTTEQFPVHVIVGEASEGRYLFTAEMSKEQLSHLRWLVNEHPEFRGKYHALAKTIVDAITAELDVE